MERVYAEGDTIVIIDSIISTVSAQMTKYESTMTGNETYAMPGSGIRSICFLDPNGSDRTFNPSGSYTAGYEIVVINKGANLITIDSSGCAKVVSFGETKSIVYNGTSWY